MAARNLDSVDRQVRRCLTLAAVCFGAATGMHLLLPVLFGTPQAKIHITWRGIDQSEQRSLEQAFRLSEPMPLGGGRWAYVPLDPTPERLRAIITHRAVAATDGINRPALRLSRRAPLTERRGGVFPHVPAAARATRAIVYLLTGIGLLGLAVGAAAKFGLTRQRARLVFERVREHPVVELRAGAAQAVRFVQRGVPVASPMAAGAFRVVFVALVVAFVATNPAHDIPLGTPAFDDAKGLQRRVVQWLSVDPSRAIALDWVLVTSGTLVVLGLMTRVVYAAFACAFLFWACVYTLDTTHHTVSALTLIVLGLLAAPWGDGWSVDSLLKRRWGRGAASTPGRRYGYATWLPCFVYGVTMLAAVWSKIGSGPDWILNGTVKYHFVSDLEHAWVKWGPALTSNTLVAILMSAAAIAIEASVIVGAFTRSPWVRTCIGFATMALLCGFAVFQGIVWVGWWIPLVAFLPWDRLPPGQRASIQMPASRLTRPQLAVVGALIVQQLTASFGLLEGRPLLSAYDMYSKTYLTPEEYESSSNLTYRVLVTRSDRSIELPGCAIDDRAAANMRADRLTRARLSQLLRSGHGACTLDGELESVTLEGDRQVYDWNTGRFTLKQGVEVIGPVPVIEP